MGSDHSTSIRESDGVAYVTCRCGWECAWNFRADDKAGRERLRLWGDDHIAEAVR
jgi:hypothetical protein